MCGKSDVHADVEPKDKDKRIVMSVRDNRGVE